jgi:hypothetical protein
MDQNIVFDRNSEDIREICRPIAEKGVGEGIGARPGEWKVTLKEPQNDSNWYIRIEGPSRYQREFVFVGEEQTAEHICQTIDQALS